MIQHIPIILTSFFLSVSVGQVTAQTTHTNTKSKETTTTTATINGKTDTNTTVSSNGENGYGIGIATAYDGGKADTIKWKSREISKEYNIADGTPIFIESSNKNIDIKTWDQPSVRIVGNVRYLADSDANLSLDEVFEKNNIKIKKSDQAFEILGASSVGGDSYGLSYSYSNDDANGSANGDIPSPTPQLSVNILKTNGVSNFIFSGDSIIKISDDIINSDSTMDFSQKESSINNKRKSLDERERALKLKQVQFAEIGRKNAQKVAELSEKIGKLSKEMAALSVQDANKNSKEIARLNREIAKLSNQISFQSLNNSFSFKLDSANKEWKDSIRVIWRHSPVKAIKINNKLITTSDALPPLKWTIYIPQNHKISIDSKYGNIHIENDLDAAKIISKYGNVETQNVNNLTVRNQYGNVQTNNIKDGYVEIRSGKLRMQNVGNLKIESKNAEIDLEEVGNIHIESSNDNYDISSIKELNANKNYGTFRLTTLSGKMQFTGVNSDIKIRNIAPTTTNIDITNKFAKIAVPLSDLKNYNIAVNGEYNNSFDDFNLINKNDKGFTATKGNGKDLNTHISCNSCQLDFK